MTQPVKWLGLSAVYSPEEREIIAALTVREQTFVHALKAMTDGEIQESVNASGEGGENPSVKPKPAPSPVYTKPEDIEFGAPPLGTRPDGSKIKRLYAVVWTWRSSKMFPSKSSKFPWKSAEHRTHVWKRWYERQGWKVSSHQAGYFAAGPNGERHVVLIHEYERDTHQRLA